VFLVNSFNLTSCELLAGEDLVLCPRDFPHLKENDVIEIFNPEDNCPHLLLKLMRGSLWEDFLQKGTVCVVLILLDNKRIIGERGF